MSREGEPDLYFGDDDTIRQHWHDDAIGHVGALHLFYRPVNDMRVLLPLVVCIIVAWIRSFFFLMGTCDATALSLLPLTITEGHAIVLLIFSFHSFCCCL